MKNNFTHALSTRWKISIVINNEVSLLHRNSKFKQLPCEQCYSISIAKTLHLKECQEPWCMKKVAVEFGVTNLLVSKIWKVAQKQYNDDKICADVTSKHFVNVDRNIKKNSVFSCRNVWTVRHLEMRKEYKTYISSTVKISLTDQNKLERLQLCLSKVRPNGRFEDL